MNSKRYNLVMYEEMDIVKFITASQNNRGKNISQIQYAYIFHNRDEKKSHYHLYIEFPEAVKTRDIEKILTLVNIPISSLSYEKTNSNFLAYLTHNTPQDFGVKASYRFDEIISNMVDIRERWENAIEAVNKPNRQQQKLNKFTTIMTNLKDIVSNNPDIISISTLYSFLLDNGYIEELQYCMNKTYAIKSMFEQDFRENTLYTASHHLKHENKKRLRDLQEDWNTAQENEKKIDEIEDKIAFYENTR